MNSYYKKFISTLFSLTISLFLLSPGQLQSQNIEAMISDYTGLPGVIAVPVLVNQFQNVHSISLTINYDTTLLTFLSLDKHPVLDNNLFVLNTSEGQIRFASYNPYIAINLADSSTLFTIHFDGLPGTSSLTWNSHVYGDCMLTNQQGAILPTTYIDGTVTLIDNSLLPACAINPSPSSGSSSSTGKLEWHAGGSAVSSYKVYFGTTNPPANLVQNTLDSVWQLPNLTIGTHYYWKVVPNNSMGDAYGCPVWDFIHQPDTIITTAGSYSGNAGMISIPVTIEHFTKVAVLSLALGYDPSLLTFYTATWNPLLSGIYQMFGVLNNQVKFSWFNATPVTLSDGDTLVTLLFEGVPGSGQLSWDVVTYGNCQYGNVFSNIIPAAFVNGTLNITPNPLVPDCAGGPLPASGSVSNSGTLSWQSSTSPATAYKLYFDTLNPPLALVQNSLDTTWSLPEMIHGTQFYWKVVPYNGHGDAYGCPIWNFIHSADTIVTAAGSYYGLPGTFTIPLTVNHFQDIASISLSLSYDTTTLTFLNLNANPVFSGSAFVFNADSGMLSIGFFSLTPVSLDEGAILCTISFEGVVGVSPLTWNINMPFYCQYTDVYAHSLPVKFIDGFVNLSLSGFPVTGSVVYDNVNLTPLSQVTVLLKLGNTVVNQTTTDMQGNFTFPGIPQGSYMLHFQTNKNCGGYNAVDALFVLKHFTGLTLLEGLRLLAGDVNASGFLNATDALLIQKRFVEMIQTFQTGNWCIPPVSLEVGTSQPLPVQVRGLCFGDVNGSFIFTN